MPRPRVKPQDRKRSVRACLACKTSKKRCDGTQPCRTCLKKGIADSCTFSPQRRGVQSVQTSGPASLQPLPPVEVDPQVGTARYNIATPTERRPRPRESDDVRSTRDTTPSAGQRSTMLYSSSGERVYMGGAAAVSFLQFLQAIVKRYVGPVGFTESQNSRKMFEADVPDTGTDFFADELMETEKWALVQCFLHVSNGLLDLFTWEEVNRIVKVSNSNRMPNSGRLDNSVKEDLTALYMMVAIGAQCKGSTQDDLLCAARYFSQARKMAFEGFLEDPTVYLARDFLLMAFYMFGACRRNSAFMYIGVAAKASIVLGLHVSGQYRQMPAEERARRLRIGKSIRVLDLVSSSILGRPGSTSSLRTNDVYANDLDQDANHRTLAINAAYEASSVLEAIVQRLAEGEKFDTNSADHFLQIWHEWSQALPDKLRLRPRKESEPGFNSKHREDMIGNIHVACMYYFGVILVTRQSLIQHIMPQIRGKQLKKRPSRQDNGEEGTEKAAELSSVCTDAATYMAQMCCDAAEAGILWGNMCILKAWLFAAGLVLGFSLLAEAQTTSEIRDAFYGACRLLGSLGHLSPQAAQYHRILTSFSEAIDVYRERLRSERYESRTPFVERILTLDPSGGTNGDQQSPQEPTSSIVTTNNGPIAEENEDESFMESLSGFLSLRQMPDWSPPPGNDDLMLRLFWEGYAFNFTDYLPPDHTEPPST
ncbi:uncharacterized protein BDW43DRAFT_258899 [Aspergillus alliaceus]|uniref:uncharacterized protein n=1 Tax=Petromyces alliaceus TaxID=209559 RepID=UPI0012A46C36|nr:uncharacterized protein BDW43DRAFT_258899 [Aspergillus alliaceus]KAB8239694.1 hypothetical protein BDW43DRAFT_258899 [Aspergillus alliaceus]